MDREKQIVRASATNVVGNILLAVAKGVAGVATGSVAILLDAVNSLIDGMASVIAIIGTKLAGKTANRDHPFGYGRMEYLTSMAISALILAAGFSSFGEAVRSILHPSTPHYDIVPLAIVAIAAVVKFVLGVYLHRLGKKINSGSLVGTGKDSIMDGFVSLATFAAGIIYNTMGLQIESLLAAVIALLIIKTGAQILLETASKILGERLDSELVTKVVEEARAVDGVKDAGGVVLIDFGPDRVGGDIHVTVNDQMTVSEFDVVAHAVRRRVWENCKVILGGVTPYPETVNGEVEYEVRSAVGSIVLGDKQVVDLRGFYVDADSNTVRFDVVVDFGTRDIEQLRERIVDACTDEYPDWYFEVRVRFPVSD